MPGQYLAKMYVDKLLGNPVPTYFDRLTMRGDGLLEKAFKYKKIAFQPPIGQRALSGVFVCFLVNLQSIKKSVYGNSEHYS